MPIELREESDGRILLIDMSGTLTKEDYERFTPEAEAAVKKHPKVRILARMHDFHGWSLSALWEDVKFDLHHFGYFDRLAFVGDKRWEKGMAMFCKPFTTAAIRYFDERDASEAEAWIHEGIEQAAPLV